MTKSFTITNFLFLCLLHLRMHPADRPATAAGSGIIPGGSGNPARNPRCPFASVVAQ